MNLLKYIRLATEKPSCTLRGVLSLVEAHIFNKKVLRGVELAITYKCQARCDKCSCRTMIDNSRAEMTTQQVLYVCKQVTRAGAILINLTGGEPLLRDDIVDIVREINKMPVLISLTTNGLLLERYLGKLRWAGLNVLQISLNSPFEEEHDEQIGVEGSYRKVLAGIKEAKALGIEVLINTVVTREILYSERITELLKLVKKNRCILSLIIPAAVGGWSNKDVSLTEEDYKQIQRLLKYNFVTTDTESCYRGGRCPAGTEKVYISPYGDLYPCPFIQHRYGNVFESNFIELWKGLPGVGSHYCLNIKK